MDEKLYPNKQNKEKEIAATCNYVEEKGGISFSLIFCLFRKVQLHILIFPLH